MTETLTIPERFNGPPGSANGGYACGRLAELVGTEVVAASLWAPPPMGRPLAVVREGDRVELRDGDMLVADAAPAELMIEVPDPVSFERAHAASEAGAELWTAQHPFPTCVVCGPQRRAGDGMRLFPAWLEDDRYAAAWTPEESLGDEHGHVRPEFVWAALDCPTSAPVANFGSGPAMVLARLTARLGYPVRAGEQHAIVSWPVEVDGRKRHAAAALYDREGRVLCASRALWIELRE